MSDLPIVLLLTRYALELKLHTEMDAARFTQ